MYYTFLGHQSWLIEEGSTKVLLDPLLMDTVGMDLNLGIEVVPSRTIDVSYLQDLSAIILSHEYSDHFHLPSLKLLPKTIPVFVGVLTLSPVIKAIEKLGFTVHKVLSKETINLEGMDIRFYQAPPKKVLWESRVYQVLIRSLMTDYSIFIAVDTLISKDFQDEVLQKTVPGPNTILISNNSQIPPEGAVAALNNAAIPQTPNKSRCGPVGLGLIGDIMVDYSDMMHSLEHIVLCGGDFMKSADIFGELMMSNQAPIAAPDKPTYPDKKIVGAVPGMRFCDDIDQSQIVDWVQANNSRRKVLKDKLSDFTQNPHWQLRSLCGTEHNIDQYHQDCQQIVDTFEEKHRQILCSEFGRILISYGHDLHLFEFELLSINKTQKKRYRYSPTTGRFSLIDDASAPPSLFGIKAIAMDLAAVIRGKIQIWDIADISILSWYDPQQGSSIKFSPMGLLYAVLGEHFDISTYDEICERNLKKISTEELPI